MVRRELVAAKTGRARSWLNSASAVLLGPLDTFLADPQRRDLSLFYLFLAIQECIDLAAHWVADEGWGEPDDAGSAFDVLADRGLITRDTSTNLRMAAGLRKSDRAWVRVAGLRARAPRGAARDPRAPHVSGRGHRSRGYLNWRLAGDC